MALEAGSPAPEFTLPSQSGNKVSLSDFKGKPVVLLWFPAAFTSG
jgi:peroxiredoxin Q/BCP